MIIMKSAMNLSHGYTLITKRVVLTMGSTLISAESYVTDDGQTYYDWIPVIKLH